ncbi:unnamed protein product, partial [Mesorhabditis belari]|uniref:DNA helicase n=1 Tax=Mesorhabditis belari TaxID=2138241 RepID=A0AAF3EEE0_9BILA
MAPVTRANIKGSRSATTQMHLPKFFAIRKRGAGNKGSTDSPKKCKVATENQTKAWAPIQAKKVLGILSELPPILYPDFFEHLSADELFKLSMLSMDLYGLVTDFIFSGAFLVKLLREIEDLSAPEVYQRDQRNVAYNYGRLLKMATVLKTSEERIKFLVKLMEAGLEESNMSAWGMILTTYSDYWEFTECSRLLDAVLDIHDGTLRKLVAEVMVSSDGKQPELEMQVRLAIRGLFLDMQYSDQAASAFWLAAVLNKLTTPEYRPKFFMLLFLDPVEANGKKTLDWRRMVTEVITSYYHSMRFISPLSKALTRLLSTAEHLTRPCRALAYTRSMMFNLVEEITTYPEPWSLDTYTALHVHEPSLISLSIEMRMQQQLYAESGNILSQVKNMAVEWSLPIEKVVEEPILKLFTWLSSTTLRKTLLVEFVKANANHYAECLNAGLYQNVQRELSTINVSSIDTRELAPTAFGRFGFAIRGINIRGVPQVSPAVVLHIGRVIYQLNLRDDKAHKVYNRIRDPINSIRDQLLKRFVISIRLPEKQPFEISVNDYGAYADEAYTIKLAYGQNGQVLIVLQPLPKKVDYYFRVTMVQSEEFSGYFAITQPQQIANGGYKCLSTIVLKHGRMMMDVHTVDDFSSFPSKFHVDEDKLRTLKEELNILTPTQPSFVPSSNQSIVLSSYHRGVRLVRDEFQERESLDVLSDTFMDRPTSDTYGASKEGSRLDVSSYVQDTLLGVTSLTQHLSSGSEGIDHDEMEFPRKRDSPQSMRHRKKFYGDDTMQGPFSTTAVADTVRRRLPASPLLTTAELPLPHKRVRTLGRTKIEHSKTTKKTPIKDEKLNVDDPYTFKDDEEDTIKLASTRAKASTTLHQRSMPSPMDPLSEIPQPHQRTGGLRAKSKIKFMAEKLTKSPNQQTKKQALELVHNREAERHTSKKVEGQKGLENDGEARRGKWLRKGEEKKSSVTTRVVEIMTPAKLGEDDSTLSFEKTFAESEPQPSHTESVAISSIITDQFDLVQPLGGELLPHSKFLRIRSSQGSTAQSSLSSNVKFSKSKNKLQLLTNAKRKNEEEKDNVVDEGLFYQERFFSNDGVPDYGQETVAEFKHISDVFRRFIREFSIGGFQMIYREQLKKNYNLCKYQLDISLNHLRVFDEDAEKKLRTYPMKFMPALEEAAKIVADEVTKPRPEGQEQVQDIQVTLGLEEYSTTIRKVKSTQVSQIIKISGIIVASSQVRAKATKLTLQCRQCHHTIADIKIKSGFDGYALPRQCGAPQTGQMQRCPMDPYVILPDKCICVDYQTLKLQENPEDIPHGEMPRHLPLYVDRYLTDKVSPGCRVTILGVYSIRKTSMQKKNAEKSMSGIRVPYMKVLGIKVETNGAGRAESTEFTPEQERAFHDISKRADVYDLISKSIAPSIYGSADIKKSIACLLFGGSRKRMPDGITRRGDINLLLLGDPGTAKSQLLKFVEKVSPIGVYTSGKGSSAAGLTASIVRDPNTRGFIMEGGAMVLADGGVVCIDEVGNEAMSGAIESRIEVGPCGCMQWHKNNSQQEQLQWLADVVGGDNKKLRLADEILKGSHQLLADIMNNAFILSSKPFRKDEPTEKKLEEAIAKQNEFDQRIVNVLKKQEPGCFQSLLVGFLVIVIVFFASLASVPVDSTDPNALYDRHHYI